MNNTEQYNFEPMLTTLGTDSERKFAWVFQRVNDIDCIVLYKRQNDGTFVADEKNFVCAKPVKAVVETLLSRMNL